MNNTHSATSRVIKAILSLGIVAIVGYTSWFVWHVTSAHPVQSAEVTVPAPTTSSAATINKSLLPAGWHTTEVSDASITISNLDASKPDQSYCSDTATIYKQTSSGSADKQEAAMRAGEEQVRTTDAPNWKITTLPKATLNITTSTGTQSIPADVTRITPPSGGGGSTSKHAYVVGSKSFVDVVELCSVGGDTSTADMAWQALVVKP